VVNVSAAAVLASSHHRALAERFVAFLVSRAGQQLIAHGDDFEYPARPGVAPNSQLPALAGITHASINAVALGNDVQAARMIARAGFGS
jgi:iron(III) transport system substrate-binding protein